MNKAIERFIYYIQTGKRMGIDDNVPARPRPSIEQKREWEHGDQGKGKDCNRANKPVYTAPNERPGICRDYSCDNTEYYSKGIVEREKGTKKILTRDGKKVE